MPVYQIFSSNTDVGKTIFSTALCRGALTSPMINASAGPNADKVFYLKPVQTGYPTDSDARFVRRFCPKVEAETLFTYTDPVSPHLAAIRENRPLDDNTLLQTIRESLAQHVKELNGGKGLLFLETAGGVHSPTASGALQSSAYRALRSPTILIGDSKLGGISTTLTSYESLLLNGYEIPLLLLFENNQYNNHDIIIRNVENGTKVVTIPLPPPLPTTTKDPHAAKMLDLTNLMVYFEGLDSQMKDVVRYLIDVHEGRVNDLKLMAGSAEQKIWWPFTQHTLVKNTTVIDSAYGDYFMCYESSSDKNGDGGKACVKESSEDKSGSSITTTQNAMEMTPLFDGSASWWTQAFGHSDRQMAVAAARAAGRYGHVLFPECIHEPAWRLADKLLNTVGNDWASRVFYSDNGSTATEVAIKMAIKYAEKQRDGYSGSGSVKDNSDLGVIGISGGYHGDTLGSMNASNPNVYNAKINWYVLLKKYSGKGFWFEPPSITFKNGKYHLRLPETLSKDFDQSEITFQDKESVFSVDRPTAHPDLTQLYRTHIQLSLQAEIRNGKKFGALIIEPVLMGAGGMVWVDPLFQRELINAVRTNHLATLGKESNGPIPVIFDEVLVGIHRLGPITTSQYLHEKPDIACYAKALSGGLIPLAVTLASEKVFDTFKGDQKSEALLHGHSYTAHPIGCQVALRTMEILDTMGDLKDGSKVYWDDKLVNQISSLESVDGVVCLGTVFAVELAASSKGYNAIGLSRRIAQKLRTNHQVFVRPLGNIIYVVVSLTTSITETTRLLQCLMTEIEYCARLQAKEKSGQSSQESDELIA
ncbi:hypothetical protein HDU76_000901 [Blyttiomyces sp. JEL0837]|nr:hypothetical protein HDU76_000901 [Blyttiomyces sp. JEL0837]